jgi:hypothetical protein
MKAVELDSGKRISAPIESDLEGSVRAVILDSGEKIPVPVDPVTDDPIPIDIEEPAEFPTPIPGASSKVAKEELLSEEEVPIFIQKGGKKESMFTLLRLIGYPAILAFGSGLIILLIEFLFRRYFNFIRYVITNRRIIMLRLSGRQYITLDNIRRIEWNKTKNGSVEFVSTGGKTIQFKSVKNPHELLRKTYIAAVNFDGRGSAVGAATTAVKAVEEPKDF